jgi:serine/threonine protein kinase
MDEIGRDLLMEIQSMDKPSAANGKTEEYVLVYQRDRSGKPTLSDFEVISLIGQGSISKVYLVYMKSTNKTFAMKCISKANIVK